MSCRPARGRRRLRRPRRRNREHGDTGSLAVPAAATLREASGQLHGAALAERALRPRLLLIRRRALGRDEGRLGLCARHACPSPRPQCLRLGAPAVERRWLGVLRSGSRDCELVSHRADALRATAHDGALARLTSTTVVADRRSPSLTCRTWALQKGNFHALPRRAAEQVTS